MSDSEYRTWLLITAGPDETGSLCRVGKGAHLILRRACPTWGARLEGRTQTAVSVLVIDASIAVKWASSCPCGLYARLQREYRLKSIIPRTIACTWRSLSKNNA